MLATMATAKEKMTEAHHKLTANAAKAKDIGAVYKFILEGEGGGTFVMDLKDNPSVTETEGDAPCVITMSAGDCVDMLEGRVTGQELFFGGKLRIDGDMGLAMKLEPLLELLR